MQTEHVVHVADARAAVADLDTDSVDLVVTSPPYPMVEMWDASFTAQDPAIGEALDANEGDRAFDLMHDLLDDVWRQLPRVVRPGGIVVVNVGPATRNLDGFQQYPNQEAVTRRLREHGLQSLPNVLWRKPTNSAAKFMGSGMLPTNAYPTLEHEYLLVFRNGGTRSFPPGDDRRYESAYFWEERNEWFSDLWELTGERQALSGDAAEARDRSGAFPLDLPLRLVRMFSVYGDTVLDPFWGTGTTSLAALAAGRSSVGVERDPDLVAAFDERVADAPALSTDLARERLERHREFVADRRADGDEPGYDAEHYEFPVVTTQERRIRLYETTAVRRTAASDERRRYVADHEPV
ncbi:modification methylase [Halobacteriales archaeon QS_4_70_19]|nr:MAG: modification methylase [Halobacteriales archaeon QS_4_70_19]